MSLAPPLYVVLSKRYTKSYFEGVYTVSSCLENLEYHIGSTFSGTLVAPSSTPPTIIEFNRTQKASHTFFEPQPFAPSLFGAKNEFRCLCPNRANYPGYQVADILSEEKVLKQLFWTLIQSLSTIQIHPFVKQLIIVEKKVLSGSSNLSRLPNALRPKCQSQLAH